MRAGDGLGHREAVSLALAIPADRRRPPPCCSVWPARAPVETHISAVFLGADTVWKLRKAVRLPFLDFSTLAERQRTAGANSAERAAAPGLYRDVVPVVRRAGRHAGARRRGRGGRLGGAHGARAGRRFPRAPPAAAGWTPALLDALGDAVAAWHAALRAGGQGPGGGDAAQVADGNAHSALRRRPAGRRGAALARRRAAPPWPPAPAGCATRAARGFVRRAHGDLHLGNICLWQGRPVPFDALEFDEDLATIDLGYDLAFLLMDLDVRAGRPAANRVLNRYVARTGDCGLVAGLPPFLSLRAMVRAHVEARRGRAGEAARYLDAALAYLRPPPPVRGGGRRPAGHRQVHARPRAGAGARRRARARWSCAATRSASACTASRRSSACRRRPMPSRSAARCWPSCAAPWRETAAAGHAAIADATFLDPADRARRCACGGPAPFPRRLAAGAAGGAGGAGGGARSGDASDADVAVLRRAAAGRTGPGDWLAVDATDAGGGAARAVAARAGRAAVIALASTPHRVRGDPPWPSASCCCR